MKLLTHEHNDTRLKCQECAEAICPKCMIQCAVGFRCKKCAARFTSHVIQVKPLILAKTAVVAAGIGYAFGLFEEQLSSIGGIYAIVMIFFVGWGIGKVLHRVAQHKLGPKIILGVIVGLLVGYLVSPIRDQIFGAILASGHSPSLANNMISTQFFDMALFAVGVLTPFLRR
jgi:hypothetical protein